MKAIGNILIWRAGKGSRRISVGTIKKKCLRRNPLSI
jgi:hypothetical protein